MRELPALGPNRELRLPESAERTLANGLTVIAIRRPGVPLVELRLRLPFAGADVARVSLMTRTLFSGTAEMSTVDIAAELQAVGGGLSAGADPDRLMVSGNALASGLDRLLEILAEVLNGATYPADEVATERDRLVDQIQVAQTQPAHLARVALLRRMYGTHPYAVQTPQPHEVKEVDPADLRALHAARLHPNGATLVLVGDLIADQAIETVARMLDGWSGPGSAGSLPPTPPLEPGALVIADRPDSVQSSIRMALPAVPRTHPDHAALQLANLVFGGYFSSRWVENIREDKGYTYGPHSVIEHSVAGSALIISTDVATEVTAPALLETWYELGRLATLPPAANELDQARQYALGTLQLGMATQAGVASLASTYAGFGLRLDYLAEHARRLVSATPDDVAAVAQRYLAPAGAVSVVLGDAARISPSVAALTPVRTTTASADPGEVGVDASEEAAGGAG